MLEQLREELQQKANPLKAQFFSRFFKTGPGHYGEGDIFIGIPVPVQRQIAKKYIALSPKEIQRLLKSPIHEFRLTALIILVAKYRRSSPQEQDQIYNFYLTNTLLINNWDLVDLSAPNIVGRHLLNKDKAILYELAVSQSLWERRIAMIACLTFIKNKRYEETLKIAELLLHDTHDLIQKAVGWMLREVGKQDVQVEQTFLNAKYKTMPRTTLRYAIERFEAKTRAFYMKK